MVRNRDNAIREHDETRRGKCWQKAEHKQAVGEAVCKRQLALRVKKKKGEGGKEVEKKSKGNNK